MCRLLTWAGEVEAERDAAHTDGQKKKRVSAKDTTVLKEAVAGAVSGREGWEDVAAEDVVLSDCSGHGGSRTFRCTRKGADKAGPAVALHVISEEFSYSSSQPEFVKRSRAASHALAMAGVAPESIGEHDDEWFIEAWEGSTHGGTDGMHGLEQAAKLGRLLARIHAVPTDWYDASRASYISRFPVLADVPKSSSLWYHSTRSCWMNESKPEWAVRLVAAEELAANSPAGNRVCTVHGDFHR